MFAFYFHATDGYDAIAFGWEPSEALATIDAGGVELSCRCPHTVWRVGR